MEFYIHVNTFWEVFQSFSRNIFLFTGNVTLVRIMLPYSICSTVDFPFSEEGIFRSDFNHDHRPVAPPNRSTDKDRTVNPFFITVHLRSVR